MIPSGNLVIISPDGLTSLVGDGVGHQFVLRVRSYFVLPKIMLNPWYQLPTQYVLDSWKLEHGTLPDLLALLFRHCNRFERDTFHGRLLFKLRRAIFVLSQKNGILRSYRNVQHHYDIGNDLFESFLDQGLNYTCADFECGANGIDEAQQTKLLNTLRRLDVGAGQKLLEIGCGWGALSRLAAVEFGAVVTGLTLSRNQLSYAQQKAASISSELRPRYVLEDYRQHRRGEASIYDRIVSVGMLEHVGLRDLRTYFAQVNRLLKSDGVVLVHTIARRQVGVTNPWLSKNIFPGGYIAQEGEIVAAALSHGFELAANTHHYGAENYVRTLKAWDERFARSWPLFLKYRYPESVRRTYTFYFAASEAAFREELDMRAVQFVFRRVSKKA